MTAIEKALAGQKATKEAIAGAVKDAGSDLDAINADIHASEEYRRAMIPVFTKRAVEAALARA
jgi:carbon-monoxide dehydrogenase medium subunit